MKNAYLFALDTLSDWEPGYLTAELNSGRMFAEPGTRVPVRTVGISREPITTLGGMRITPEFTVDEIRPDDAAVLLLIGADTWAEPKYAPVMDKVRELLAAGVPVAAICGATVALAEAGILDDRPHTSNSLEQLTMFSPSYQGAEHYVDAPAVTDGDLITATGTNPLAFARHVLTRLGVLSQETLEAWYGLYSTGKPEYFHAMMASLPQPVEA